MVSMVKTSAKVMSAAMDTGKQKVWTVFCSKSVQMVLVNMISIESSVLSIKVQSQVCKNGPLKTPHLVLVQA